MYLGFGAPTVLCLSLMFYLLAFQLFLKLLCDISLYLRFCRVFVIFKFLFLGLWLKAKIWESQIMLVFYFFVLNFWNHIRCKCFFFLGEDNVITLIDCFFYDFRGLQNFKVFYLTAKFSFIFLSLYIVRLSISLTNLLKCWF